VDAYHTIQYISNATNTQIIIANTQSINQSINLSIKIQIKIQIIKYYAKSRKRIRQGCCESHEIQGVAKIAILLPNVRKTMPGSKWIQVPFPKRIAHEANEDFQ